MDLISDLGGQPRIDLFTIINPQACKDNQMSCSYRCNLFENPV